MVVPGGTASGADAPVLLVFTLPGREGHSIGWGCTPLLVGRPGTRVRWPYRRIDHYGKKTIQYATQSFWSRRSRSQCGGVNIHHGRCTPTPYRDTTCYASQAGRRRRKSDLFNIHPGPGFAISHFYTSHYPANTERVTAAGYHDGDIELRPGTVVHLRAMVVHEVSAPDDAADENVLLLTMLTGERHSDE